MTILPSRLVNRGVKICIQVSRPCGSNHILLLGLRAGWRRADHGSWKRSNTNAHNGFPASTTLNTLHVLSSDIGVSSHVTIRKLRIIEGKSRAQSDTASKNVRASTPDLTPKSKTPPRTTLSGPTMYTMGSLSPQGAQSLEAQSDLEAAHFSTVREESCSDFPTLPPLSPCVSLPPYSCSHHSTYHYMKYDLIDGLIDFPTDCPFRL